MDTLNNCTLLCRDVYTVPRHLARLLPHSLIQLINFQHTRKKKKILHFASPHLTMQMRLMGGKGGGIRLLNFRCPQGCRWRRVVIQRQSVTCKRLESSGTRHITDRYYLWPFFFVEVQLQFFVTSRATCRQGVGVTPVGKQSARYPLNRKLGGPRACVDAAAKGKSFAAAGNQQSSRCNVVTNRL